MLEKIGIGIDIVDIKKFKELDYKLNKKFYKKIFSQDEIKYCICHSNPSQHFSGKFAVKEAVIKSIKKKLPLTDIITDHFNSKPIVKLKNDSSYFFIVTLSHDKDYAVAVVLSEKI